MKSEAEIIEAVDAEFGQTCEYVRPEYGRTIRQRLAELDARAKAGVNLAVLVPGRTDTRWAWDYCRQWEVRIIRGRVRFDGHRGGAPFPSMLVVMGPAAQPARVLHWELPS